MTTAGLGAGRGLASAQSLQNAPAAIGLGFTRPDKRFGSSKKDDDKSALGMSMFFRVTIADADLIAGGDQPLGDWSSCSGLSVKFNTDPLEEGGEYDSPWHMPTKITYGEVTLERAIDKQNADKIENWLAQVAAIWMTGAHGGAKEIDKDKTATYSTTVHIELCSSVLADPRGGAAPGAANVVHQWTLNEAIPVSYTGPTLSSKSNDVATEKLTLVHRGFQSIAGTKRPAAGGAATSGQAELKLASMVDPNEAVTFPYNPKTFSMTKSVRFDKQEVQQSAEQATLDPGALSLTVNNLRLEGVKAVQNVDQLLKWLEQTDAKPAPKNAPEAAAKAHAVATPAATAKPGGEPKEEAEKKEPSTAKPLQLTYGNGIAFVVILKSVTATYTRFTKAGEANRADVNLTLQVSEDHKPYRTNPTSGGTPGGKIYTAAAGETLQNIANAAYQSPSAWRRIAAANGIDDPMRVRPGQQLYLDGTS